MSRARMNPGMLAAMAAVAAASAQPKGGTVHVGSEGAGAEAKGVEGPVDSLRGVSCGVFMPPQALDILARKRRRQRQTHRRKRWRGQRS